MVFLHGFLGRGADWLPIAEALAHGFHCLLPDLPGHGANTDLDAAAPLTFDRLSAGLAQTLDSAGVERPTLVGYSLGGRLALHYACTYPDRLTALVLESASPGLRTEGERESRRRVDDARAVRLLGGGLPTFLDEWYRAGLWASLRARPTLLAEALRTRTENDPSWAAKTLAELSPGRMEPLWDRLPDLRIPTLLLSGDLDPKYTQITAEAASSIPGSAHVRIAGAGHNIHLEQPGRFVKTAREFLHNVFSVTAQPLAGDLGKRSPSMSIVNITRSIPAPAERVWEILKTFRLDYFPGYQHTVTGEGLGTQRTFSVPNGEMTERIASFDDQAMTLTYEIVESPWPVRDYLATVRVEDDGGSAEVAWSAAFEPEGAPEEKAVDLVAGTFKMNLKALEKYLTS